MNLLGKCNTASRFRAAAKLNRHWQYNPHMTTALLRNYNLPPVIKGKLPDEWRKRLASDYLDVNMLFGPAVIVTLENGHLEKWILSIRNQLEYIKIKIVFTEHIKFAKEISIQHSKNSHALKKAAIEELKRCDDMYSYVEVLLSLMK